MRHISHALSMRMRCRDRNKGFALDAQRKLSYRISSPGHEGPIGNQDPGEIVRQSLARFIRCRGGRRRHLRPGACIGRRAAGQARGGRRPRHPCQWRLDQEFRLHHRDRPAARRMLAARHALARRLAGGGRGRGDRHPAARPADDRASPRSEGGARGVHGLRHGAPDAACWSRARSTIRARACAAATSRRRSTVRTRSASSRARPFRSSRRTLPSAMASRSCARPWSTALRRTGSRPAAAASLPARSSSVRATIFARFIPSASPPMA